MNFASSRSRCDERRSARAFEDDLVISARRAVFWMFVIELMFWQ